MESEWVAVGLTLLGFLGSLIAAWFSRAARVDASKSAQLAHDVQESMAESQALIASVMASRPKVLFKMETHSVRTCVLRNRGTETATDLVADWPEWIVLMAEMPASLDPGDGIEFGGKGRRFGERRETSMLVTCAQLPDGVKVALPSF